MIVIPQNDWKPSEEIRENVVQDICNSFLNGTIYAIFRPYNTSAYRRRTNGLMYFKGNLHGFSDRPIGDDYKLVKFTSKELNAAIKCLVKAGWHVFYSDNNGWPWIKCSKYPYLDNAREITEWTEFFDKD